MLVVGDWIGVGVDFDWIIEKRILNLIWFIELFLESFMVNVKFKGYFFVFCFDKFRCFSKGRIDKFR